MKRSLRYVICFVSVMIATTARATPPRVVLGMNSNGVLYVFDKSTGSASQVLALNSTTLNCAAGTYQGLVFFEGYFYTTCNQFYSTSYPPDITHGKVIRFGFSSGSETVFFQSPVGDPSQQFGGFTRMLSINPTYPYFMVYLVQPGGGDSRWRLVSLQSKSLLDTGNVDQPSTVAVSGCLPGGGSWSGFETGAWPDALTYTSMPNPFTAQTEISNPPASGNAPAFFPSILDSGGCQMPCMLENASLQPLAYFDNFYNNAQKDTLKWDYATGEVWAIAPNSGLLLGSGSNANVLLKIQGSSLTSFCSGRLHGVPIPNVGVDDAPRVIGSGNASAGTIDAIDFAPDYFDYPPAPTPTPTPTPKSWEPVRMLLKQAGAGA